MNDALGVLEQFVPNTYGDIVKLSDNVTIRFTDIGHLLGSASIEIWLKEDKIEKKIVFSYVTGKDDLFFIFFFFQPDLNGS